MLDQALPVSNFLLSISIPMIREAPAALAPSATYEAIKSSLFLVE